ncbi:hypothetical protein SCHIN_v1c08470 [Spiroplasma chinense]|uniref:Lipoprotein n=1 Tax=Spiroplasma chinense TaxID=216932 RepID=A0A5B9Y7G8_9MOLU|nr:hypothetical protein [Spiroplasma chinense]QEH62042.1 hypothetical protein SCHIN_v1c08470 [Spiroplasma chinense]
MKKLINLLMTSILLSSSASLVVACRGGAGMSSGYTEDERILGITSLNEKILKDYKIKFGGNVSKEESLKLIQLLGGNTDTSSSSKQMLLGSMKVFIMANLLLNQISSKVPGYGWIAGKMQWQASRWSFNDLYGGGDENALQSIGKNVSGWMVNNDEWSISVTFLDEEKLGWVGVGDPAYARINVNKRIVVDSDGEIVVEESNPNAIWMDENGVYPSAITPINQSTHEQTKNRGAIYQGFVNSSQLIGLDGIFDPNDVSVPGGILGYTPSTTDFVNNIMMESDIINETLGNKETQKEITEYLNSYLLDYDNQIYIGEGINVTHINVRFKNRIYAILFKSLLDRKNPIYENTDEDLAYGKTVLNGWWSALNKNAKVVESANYLTSGEKAEVSAIIQNFNAMRIIDQDEDVNSPGLSTSQSQKVLDDFLTLIAYSKDPTNPNDGEIDFAASNITIKMYKVAPDGVLWSGAILDSEAMYRDFGLNSAYRLGITYQNKTLTEEQEANRANFAYDPDKGKDPVTQKNEFVSDKGFKNVFFKSRMDLMLETIKAKFNEQVASEWVYQPDANTLAVTPFDLSKIANQDFSNNTWFKDAGYLAQLTNATSTDNLRVNDLKDAFIAATYSRIQELFDVTKEAEYKNIWQLGISSDNLVLGKYQDLGIDSGNPENMDDDLAFAEMLNRDTSRFHITDVNSSGQGNMRTNIYMSGFNNTSFNTRIMSGKISTYGDILTNQDYANWWKDSTLNSDSNITKVDIFINVGITREMFMAFANYWADNVTNNKNNPDYFPPYS